MNEDEKSILDDPKYKASVQRIEDAVRDHHRLLEDWGNENDEGDAENTMVVGWVLTIGQVGFADGREFHSAVVEYPDTLNQFHALGLADYSQRFLRYQTSDFTAMGEER